MDRNISIVLCSVVALSVVFFLLVSFPPGLRRYRTLANVGPVLSSFAIPPQIASDLYNLLGPAVGLRVYSPYGVSEETIFLSPMGVAGVVPGIHVETSTVFEMSEDEYLHWCQRGSELVSGFHPKAIYVDAVFSFLFDVKVRPVWKKAGLIALATKYAA